MDEEWPGQELQNTKLMEPQLHESVDSTRRHKAILAQYSLVTFFDLFLAEVTPQPPL